MHQKINLMDLMNLMVHHISIFMKVRKVIMFNGEASCLIIINGKYKDFYYQTSDGFLKNIDLMDLDSMV